MNNLKKLREDAKLSTRDLAKYVGTHYTTIHYLEHEERPLRFHQIQCLCRFFDVSSDYLLGRSDTGYCVTIKQDEEEIIMSEKEYNQLREHIVTKVIEGDDIALDLSARNRIPCYKVYRELKGNPEDYDLRQPLEDKLSYLVDYLSNQELKKVISFVEKLLKD